MTDGAKTPHERAAARVRGLLDDPTREAAEAGYVIGFRIGDIVTAVEEELGDAALRLPRHYPADEGQALLLGPARRVDSTTGKTPNVYATVKTGLPNGRVHVRIVEAETAQAASRPDAPAVVEWTAAPDSLPHPLRALLAACEHSAATVVVSAGEAR